jgi:acyl carrier protein
VSGASANDVRLFVLAHVAPELATTGRSPQEVPDDFDLLVEQVIDSFGLLELIVAVEHRFAVQLDFENLDADDLTVIGPFCRYVEAQSAAASEAP